MHLELTNQTLATILMDCMHHYPSFKNVKEAFGIILGTTESTSYVGEYSFPIPMWIFVHKMKFHQIILLDL